MFEPIGLLTAVPEDEGPSTNFSDVGTGGFAGGADPVDDEGGTEVFGWGHGLLANAEGC